MGESVTVSKTRGKNWSENEKEALTQAVRSKHDILFGKLGPHLTFAQKSAAWKEVVDCVNACCLEPRSLIQCQEKFKLLKKEVKAAAAKNKKAIKKTGGGSPETETVDATSENILAILPKSSYQGIDGGIDTSEENQPWNSIPQPQMSTPKPCLALVVSESNEFTSTSRRYEQGKDEDTTTGGDKSKTPKRPRLQTPTEILLEKQVSLFEEQLQCMKGIDNKLGIKIDLEQEKLKLKREKIMILREMLDLKKRNSFAADVPMF